MHTLAMTLRGRRFAKGALEMDMPEVNLTFDKQGRVNGRSSGTTTRATRSSRSSCWRPTSPSRSSWPDAAAVSAPRSRRAEPCETEGLRRLRQVARLQADEPAEPTRHSGCARQGETLGRIAGGQLLAAAIDEASGLLAVRRWALCVGRAGPTAISPARSAGIPIYSCTVCWRESSKSVVPTAAPANRSWCGWDVTAPSIERRAERPSGS